MSRDLILSSGFLAFARHVGFLVAVEEAGAELTAGSLPEAVVASCAIPRVFQPVTLTGRQLWDGGAVDRVGLAGWRRWRPGRTGLVHWVEGTRGKERGLTASRMRSTAGGGCGHPSGPG